MLMIWLRGNYWETRNMSFCEGGRGEALKSRCRNGLNGGGKSLRWRRGHKERTGMYGCRRMVAASWGSFHLKASHRAGKKGHHPRWQMREGVTEQWISELVLNGWSIFQVDNMWEGGRQSKRNTREWYASTGALATSKMRELGDIIHIAGYGLYRYLIFNDSIAQMISE